MDYFDNNHIIDYECLNRMNNICDEIEASIVRNYDRENYMEIDENDTISDVIINKCFRDNSKYTQYHFSMI